MFERADRLWLRHVEPSMRHHAIEFQWNGFDPELTCVERGGDELTSVDLGKVDFVISEARECVGYFEGDSYVRCPSGAHVTRFVQCAQCAGESFIPFQECVFEPKCDGEICGTDFCSREHVLYVAFYDTKVKIGMSSTRRIERRLIEQGADAYSIVGSYPTRRRAREAEREMSSNLSVPQFLRQGTVLNAFTKAVDVSGIEERHRSLASTMESRFGIELEELHWLDEYPIALPLQRHPRPAETPGRHRGRLIGAKGRWLIYDSGTIQALNLPDIPSRFMDVGK